MEMFHITQDGEYLTGVPMDNEGNQTTQWEDIRQKYAGMQAWCKTGSGSWYTVPAVDVGRGRWQGLEQADVPECVRMAEMLR